MMFCMLVSMATFKLDKRQKSGINTHTFYDGGGGLFFHIHYDVKGNQSPSKKRIF